QHRRIRAVSDICCRKTIHDPACEEGRGEREVDHQRAETVQVKGAAPRYDNMFRGLPSMKDLEPHLSRTSNRFESRLDRNMADEKIEKIGNRRASFVTSYCGRIFIVRLVNWRNEAAPLLLRVHPRVGPYKLDCHIREVDSHGLGVRGTSMVD